MKKNVKIVLAVLATLSFSSSNASALDNFPELTIDNSREIMSDIACQLDGETRSTGRRLTSQEVNIVEALKAERDAVALLLLKIEKRLTGKLYTLQDKYKKSYRVAHNIVLDYRDQKHDSIEDMALAKLTKSYYEQRYASEIEDLFRELEVDFKFKYYGHIDESIIFEYKRQVGDYTFKKILVMPAMLGFSMEDFVRRFKENANSNYGFDMIVMGAPILDGQNVRELEEHYNLEKTLESVCNAKKTKKKDLQSFAVNETGRMIAKDSNNTIKGEALRSQSSGALGL